MAAVRTHPLIAREGWRAILLVTALAIVVHTLSAPAALPLWLLLVALLFAFRDPAREVPSLPLAVLSPADAVVVSVDTVQDDYLNREAKRVVLRMQPFGVYSLRSPVEAKVRQQWLAPAGMERAARYRQVVWLQTDELDDVVLVMRPGRLHHRVACDASSGERIGQGQRCGFIPFGARLDLLLPATSRVLVKAGDRVRSGADPVANLVHAPR